MSEIDPRPDLPLVDWSELSFSGLLPTGTVTLLGLSSRVQLVQEAARHA